MGFPLLSLHCYVQPGGPAPSGFSYIAASYVKQIEVHSLLFFFSYYLDAELGMHFFVSALSANVE